MPKHNIYLVRQNKQIRIPSPGAEVRLSMNMLSPWSYGFQENYPGPNARFTPPFQYFTLKALNVNLQPMNISAIAERKNAIEGNRRNRCFSN